MKNKSDQYRLQKGLRTLNMKQKTVRIQRDSKNYKL